MYSFSQPTQKATGTPVWGMAFAAGLGSFSTPTFERIHGEYRGGIPTLSDNDCVQLQQKLDFQ